MRIDLAAKTLTPETPEDIDAILNLVLPVEPGFTRFTRKEETPEQTDLLVSNDTQKNAPRQLTKRAF